MSVLLFALRCAAKVILPAARCWPHWLLCFSFIKRERDNCRNPDFGPQQTERMTSLDDAGRRSSSSAVAKGLKHMDALKNPEFAPRRAMLGVVQPPATVQTPSPLLGASRRPGRGAEGGMPANVLTELNSVLSKSGRRAASNHWQQERSGCSVRQAAQAQPGRWRARCRS